MRNRSVSVTLRSPKGSRAVKAMHAKLERRRREGLWPYACPDIDQGASDAHMVYAEEVPTPTHAATVRLMSKVAPAKIPAPRLVLHPSWGYACICPLCEERFQNDRDMRISEKMYARHWRERHRAAS